VTLMRMRRITFRQLAKVVPGLFCREVQTRSSHAG
jgi:hypothetical protein